MYRRAFVTFVFVLVLPTIANAQIWTSPDGFLSVTPPDATKFQAMPTPPPPFVGLWVSNDESMKFGVMKLQLPPNAKLVQSSAEEGFGEEIGGEVTRLPTKNLSGYEVWNMTAKGPTAEITQTMVRNNGAVYKVMAAAVGANSDPVAIKRFIDSLSITQQTQAVTQPPPVFAQSPSQPKSQPVQEPDAGVDLHKISKTIGGVGALLGIGLVAYLVIRGRKSRQS